MLRKLYGLLDQPVFHAYKSIVCCRVISFSNSLTSSKESKMSSNITNSMPLPPSSSTDVYKTSLKPPPFLKAIASYLTESEANLSTPNATISNSLSSQTLNSSFEIYSDATLGVACTTMTNAQCYELPEIFKNHESPKIDSKCYELPSINTYSDASINNRTNQAVYDGKYFSGVYGGSATEKESQVLKSTENVPPPLLRDDRKLQITSDDVLFPISKVNDRQVKHVFTPISKRSYSVDDGDSAVDEGTPKRPVATSTRWDQDSPQSKLISFQWRKSLPAKTKTEIEDILSPKAVLDADRRKSFPLAKSPNYSLTPVRTYKRCATDQTPYEENSLQQRKRIRPLLPRYNTFELITLKSETGFIDSHCHLDFLFQRQNYKGTYADYQKKHQDTFPASYKGCLAVFCNPFTFKKETMWQKYLEEENVWASFGCHPHNAKDYDDGVEKSLCDALKHNKVRALGEIGLDYSNRNACMKEVQFEVFRRQLKIALKEQLPVVIHCREAHEDGMRILKEILPADHTIHLHCFTDTWEWAQKWLNEFPNLFIGLTNVVTFPNAESVHEVARSIPLERLLLETDAPYFVPRTGNKGTKFSHPGMAIHVAAQIAALRYVPIEKVLQCTRQNTTTVYNI